MPPIALTTIIRTVAPLLLLALSACGGGAGTPATGPADAAGSRDAEKSAQLSRVMPDTAPRPAAGAPARVEQPATGGVTQTDPDCLPELMDDFVDQGSWTYRRLLPNDCAHVRTSAPVFSWTEPADRDPLRPWTFELTRAGSGKVMLRAQSSTPWLLLRSPLATGSYSWSVSYLGRDGQTKTSHARRFIVDVAASPVLFPTGLAFSAAVSARVHPRVLPSGSSFAEIAMRAGGSEEHADMLAAVFREAGSALDAPIPTPDQDVYGGGAPGDLTDKQSKAALRKLLEQERRYIEALGLATGFSGQAKYRSNGIKRLMELAKWSPSGPTSEARFDYANLAIYRGLAQGLDLFWQHLNADQRRRIVTRLKDRIAQTMARFDGLAHSPYNSHVDIIAWSVVESLMYAAGEPDFPEAQAWLAQAWEQLQIGANTWGDQDGGFGNGVAYAWWRMSDIAPVLAGIRVMGGVDFVQHPWLARFGDYLIAMTPRSGSHTNAFGDGTEVDGLYATYGQNQFRVYATLTGKPAHAWYAGLGEAPAQRGYKDPWNLLLLGQADLAGLTVSPPDRNAWYFEDAGVVAMHSNAAASDRSSLYFRSSEFGSWSHSAADQNAFTLVSRGRDLLVSGGYYPYYLSPHHARVTRATRYKNALTFDNGVGQAESVDDPAGEPLQSRDARGQIIQFDTRGPWSFASGDATLAYRQYDATTSTWIPLLRNAVRSVAYSADAKIAVIYDWVTSDTPRRWELNFNALTPIAITDGGAKVVNADASACIDIHGPQGRFTTHRGFAVPPENGAPDQFQARFEAANPSDEWVAVTVIREDCSDVAVTVEVSGSRAVVRIGGKRELDFNQRHVGLFQYPL